MEGIRPRDSRVGDKVPEFSLLNQWGEPVASSDYVGKPWAIYPQKTVPTILTALKA